MTYRYTPTDPFDITTHHFMVLMFNEIVLFYDSLAFHKEVVLIKRSLTRLVEVCGSRSKLAGTGCDARNFPCSSTSGLASVNAFIFTGSGALVPGSG